jgi:hypothetical protein
MPGVKSFISVLRCHDPYYGRGGCDGPLHGGSCFPMGTSHNTTKIQPKYSSMHSLLMGNSTSESKAAHMSIRRIVCKVATSGAT